MSTPKLSTDQPYWRWWQSLDESTRQTFIKTLWQAEGAPELATAVCLVCGKPLERSNLGGKPRLYCGDACKQQAVRNRAKDRKRRVLSHR